ncbi:hypothetical protein HNV12_28740, partial [Methanococcoides sp. SA1]|nr:hypothetical protein [Methanococcoides sp. SA1]
MKSLEKSLRKEIADLQLSFEIIPELIKSESTESVINEILTLITILSGCDNAVFYPETSKICKNPIGKIKSAELHDIIQEITDFKTSDKKWNYLKNSKGFIYSFKYHQEILGYMLVEDVSFPEYITEYGELFVKLSSLCSFLVMNVKVFEQIKSAEKQLIEQNLKLTQAKNAVIKANQMKDQFIAKISHEIRNPLTGIIGLSKQLNETLSDGSDKKMASFIEDAGNHLLFIIEDLLNYSKYSKGQINLQYSDFKFLDILDSVLQSNHNIIQKNNIQI